MKLDQKNTVQKTMIFLPVCVSCLCHKLRELTSIYGCLQGISTSTTLFTKEKKKKNPFLQVASRTTIPIIAEALKRLPADAQNKSNCSGPWSLSSFFRNMTKLIHPPPTLFFPKKVATAARGTELARGLLEFLNLPPGISRRSAQMTRRVNLLDSYWCAVLHVLRRGRDPENPLWPVFFSRFFFFVRRYRRSNWQSDSDEMVLTGLGEIWRPTTRVMIAATRRLGLCVFSSGGEGPQASANRRIWLEYKHLQAPDSLSYLRSPALFVPLHGPN